MKPQCLSFWVWVWTAWFSYITPAAGGEFFINFETAPVHPVELAPDGRTLAVCNLPDNRVELFDVSSGTPVALGDVPVGLDPVSVRFRTANELWVVNHISSSVNVIDLARRRVMATLQTKGGPADVVFAGSPTHAFVSCARVNTVQVFDPVTRQCVTNLVIDGERPKAMAISPDGARVYVAIFESGNASTILAPPITPTEVRPEAGPVGDPSGPYAGQNPPPNHGTEFTPPIDPDIPFSVHDLIDLPSLASKLQQPIEEVSTYLKDQLSPATQEALANYQPGSDPAPLQTALVEDFNRIIRGPLIYDAQRFGGVYLRSETQQLLAQNPQGLKRLNRLLLEDACPMELSTSSPQAELPPRVSHIVKKNAAGRWADDNNRDWTEYISGTNAHLSGRIQGWDIADHDLAVIDTSTFEVEYVSGLMNICMALAVNPASGQVTVVGTDGTNERRFEPNLRGTFLRVNLALVDHATSAKTIRDLNPHLDYTNRTLLQSERDKSLGDPRGIIWNSSGTRGYVTGMGSRNVVIIDAGGERVQEEALDVGDGPTGMAIDEPRNRLYVLNRFSATLSVVDTLSNTVLTNVPFFDPTPLAVKLGRPHFYDTRRNSGLGHTACGSCHVDGRMDRLAWDLGDPSGDFLVIIPGGRNDFARPYHPMKGPMVTQTLQDIIGHEPFHWRADREGIEKFNPTFRNLLGRNALLTDSEMAEFKNFLRSMYFPPNLYRNLDDTLPESVPLPGLYGGEDRDKLLVRGDPRRGRSIFFHPNNVEDGCQPCHTRPTGLGGDLRLPPGPNGEHNFVVLPNERTLGLFFKIPQLRNVSEKTGLDYARVSSRAGFGFTHDGRADTLSEFLFRSFPALMQYFQGDGRADRPQPPADTDENIADTIAFLFCFSGTDAFINPFFEHLLGQERNKDNVAQNQDVATAVGQQRTITSSNLTAISGLLRLADSPSNRVDLVVRGAKDEVARGWYFAGNFLSDREGEELSPPALLALATPENPLTLTLVPRGSGRRIGIDRDNDGWPDRTEIDAGFDPADPNSHGPNTRPRLTLSTNYMGGHPGMTLSFDSVTDVPNPSLTYSIISSAFPGATLDPVTGRFEWPIPMDLSARHKSRVYVRVRYSAPPYLSDSAAIFLEAAPFRLSIGLDTTVPTLYQPSVRIRWEGIIGQTYTLQSRISDENSVWWDGWFPTRAFAYDDDPFMWLIFSPDSPPVLLRVRVGP